MITNDLRRPVPLREYLQAGCDLAAVGLEPRKFEDTMLELLGGRGLTAEERARDAARWRWDVDEILEGRDPTPGMMADGRDGREHLAERWGRLQRYVTYVTWEADLLDDPSLADSLLALMTPTEVAHFDWLLASSKAPNPLTVGRPGRASCAGCGADCSDLAMSVGEVEDFSSAPDEGPWCFSCVTMAYEAMKAAQG